ncbi:MAG: carbohydrate kinase [Gemmiger sp.]|nr:carbohydrate kinase [Gemmiger sp.]
MKRDTLFAIGEALIDFIPAQTGCDFAAVTAFSPAVGGAPANVCGAFARLGGHAALLTQLGDDPFGHKIAGELAGFGVDTRHLAFTQAANTTLAFVSLGADGGRTFSFYRNPSADLLYRPAQLPTQALADAFALHFCSVSLVEGNAAYTMKAAHQAAIAQATAGGALVSFDPNLRFPLWPDRAALKRTVWEFLPKAHLLKISDEELEFLTDSKDIEAALPALFTGQVALVLYTCGGGGAYAYTRTATAFSPSQKVAALDTTGAGDGFIGSFLWQLQQAGITPATLPGLSAATLEKYLCYSNRFCGQSVQRHGAIASYPTAAEMA